MKTLLLAALAAISQCPNGQCSYQWTYPTYTVYPQRYTYYVPAQSVYQPVAPVYQPVAPVPAPAPAPEPPKAEKPVEFKLY